MGKNEKFDVDYMMKMQLNSTDFFILLSKDNIVKLFEENYENYNIQPKMKQNLLKMVDKIKKWDANMDKNSEVPTIYAAWEH